jgi:hypothetical protein
MKSEKSAKVFHVQIARHFHVIFHTKKKHEKVVNVLQCFQWLERETLIEQAFSIMIRN